MIINIPLEFDDAFINEALSTQYEHKVIDLIQERVEHTIADEWGKRYYTDTHGRTDIGIKELVQAVVDDKIKEYKSEIIEAAAEKLATKLATHKAAKELIKEEK